MEEEINRAIEDNVPQFLAMVVPIYDKHFTHEEIKGLLKFYQTDLGRKTVRVMPILTQETMLLGQQWGKSLAPEVENRIIERFKAEGVELPA